MEYSFCGKFSIRTNPWFYNNNAYILIVIILLKIKIVRLTIIKSDWLKFWHTLTSTLRQNWDFSSGCQFLTSSTPLLASLLFFGFHANFSRRMICHSRIMSHTSFIFLRIFYPMFTRSSHETEWHGRSPSFIYCHLQFASCFLEPTWRLQFRKNLNT